MEAVWKRENNTRESDTRKPVWKPSGCMKNATKNWFPGAVWKPSGRIHNKTSLETVWEQSGIRLEENKHKDTCVEAVWKTSGIRLEA